MFKPVIWAQTFLVVAGICAIMAGLFLDQEIGLPFTVNDIDLDNANYAPPLSDHEDGRRHWLGTDLIGRDVLAGLYHGFYVSLFTALIAVLVSFLIGLPLGITSGWHKKNGFKTTWSTIFGSMILLAMVLYAVMYWNHLTWTVLLILMMIALVIPWALSKISTSSLGVDIDVLLMRLIEVFSGLPGLLVLLAVSAVLESKSIAVTGFIIGLLRWPVIMVISRNETIRAAESNYVSSGRALGMSSIRLAVKHILPNILTPLWVAAILGFASAILIESALSFLGIGVALETQTWGSLLAESRKQISAWWLAVFPGAAIFLTVISLHIMARNRS